LSDAIFPRLPGISIPYDRILSKQLTLSEAEIEIEGLPRAFCGLTLLLVTDIHAGPFVSTSVLRRTFRRLMDLEPDLIVLGGDLTTARIEEFDQQAEAFGLLQAPLGCFAVMGNHDYYNKQPEELRRRIEASGIAVLQNRAIELKLGGEGLFLAGVDDLILGTPDLEAALRGTRAPVVLVSHNPDLFFDAARAGVALMLSGHTHAGQVRIPGLPVLVRQSRYRLDEGRFRVGGTELVVSRGLGAVGVPWRLACPPEAVLLRLRERPTDSRTRSRSLTSRSPCVK
jgi:predicted MPP superfamily phosphohydrolase